MGGHGGQHRLAVEARPARWRSSSASCIEILDRAAALHLNAIIFQVRPAADALYRSDLEPWSEYLTGTQGRAPSPLWDPLAFAVTEAHARGLELHAWFNPYRAQNDAAKSPLSATHICPHRSRRWSSVRRFLWMDPGEPLVRRRTLRVVLDVVKRYDIDGVHIDDYFYPYPIAQSRGRGDLPFPDDASWQKYRAAGGKLLARRLAPREREHARARARRGDPRREAVGEVRHQPLRHLAPGFAAERARLRRLREAVRRRAASGCNEGWVDYFSPQLYWPTYKDGQAYPVLLEWWAKENRAGRHLWPGNFTSRAGARGAGSFSVSELLEQIQRHARAPRAPPATSTSRCDRSAPTRRA